MQTLVIEEHLLPLHPLPLRRTEAEHCFEFEQDAPGLLPLPTLPLPFYRRQHVRPRSPTVTVRVWVRDVGFPLLQNKENGKQLHTGGSRMKHDIRWNLASPALLELGLCPRSMGMMADQKGFQLQKDPSAVNPQCYLQRWHTLTLDEQNDLTVVSYPRWLVTL